MKTRRVPQNDLDIPRQMRLAALASLAPPLLAALLEPYKIVVRRHDVFLENLPRQAEGMRLAQLSDLHCSVITPAFVTRRAVRLCNELTPAAVLLTGDYVSRRNSYFRFSGARVLARPMLEYMNEVARELSHLRAPCGVFAVPGNHDYSEGNFEFFAELLRENGVTVLRNASTRVREIAIIGLDDLRAGTPDAPRAAAGISADEAQIILTHNPRAARFFANRNALILAGHTHGGQVHLPLTNFRRRPADMERSLLLQGFYNIGRAQLYVNNGIGSVHLPLRFRCPPEIALFTLRRGKP